MFSEIPNVSSHFWAESAAPFDFEVPSRVCTLKWNSIHASKLNHAQSESRLLIPDSISSNISLLMQRHKALMPKRLCSVYWSRLFIFTGFFAFPIASLQNVALIEFIEPNVVETAVVLLIQIDAK